MKVEVSNLDKQEITYPCLMRQTNDAKGPGERIVLFTCKSTGTVVSDTTQNPYEIGYHYSNWISSIFEPVAAGTEITLIQE